MEYVRLGSTGLKVSRLALGCMSYGDPTTPGAHEWSLHDEDAQPFFRQALDLGITFWDAANVYQAGTSEEVVGRAIKRYSRREEIVLATKVHGRMHDGSGGQGLSRKAILEQVDASLARLGTDYVDLYQIHRFDPNAPVEETMEALHDVVKAGKARYIGASSMYAWQFAKLQHAADVGGWTRFRVDAEPVQPVAPPGRARADRDVRRHGHRSGSVLPAGQGPAGASLGRAEPALHGGQGRPVVRLTSRRAGRQGRAGGRRGAARDDGQVALAWVLSKPAVSAPIVGATKPHHLAEAVAALDLQLADEEIRALEEPYMPHGPSWF